MSNSTVSNNTGNGLANDGTANLSSVVLEGNGNDNIENGGTLTLSDVTACDAGFSFDIDNYLEVPLLLG